MFFKNNRKNTNVFRDSPNQFCGKKVLSSEFSIQLSVLSGQSKSSNSSFRVKNREQRSKKQRTKTAALLGTRTKTSEVRSLELGVQSCKVGYSVIGLLQTANCLLPTDFQLPTSSIKFKNRKFVMICGICVKKVKGRRVKVEWLLIVYWLDMNFTYCSNQVQTQVSGSRTKSKGARRKNQGRCAVRHKDKDLWQPKT
ncbi:hypothetical protein Murru_3270 [Allomuricauda ruestringensis DSM 13258]|uniref:Uncharacterized protein n=1 Tax=Allomuricauda ruestringensis (strain DSM 13258 / CIP 107369 / LMG 19739 / B1) TaxID=886377 RepID=G2PMF6_ALLRU|nr:hypothetical protein Murru_3270 [Allomuricauda ruestringensis DSM 13258]